MKITVFIKDIFRKYPWLCVAGIGVSFFSSFLNAASLFTISPLIDLLVHPDGRNYSSMTVKILAIIQGCHIPAGIVSVACVLLSFVIVGALLNVLLWQFILQMRYAIMREIVLDTMREFFAARWLFFSGNDQGKMFNTFNRELAMIGSGFSSMGLMFAGIIQVAVFLTIPFYISWQVTLFSVLAGGCLSLVLAGMNRHAYAWGKQNTETSNQLTGRISEGFILAKIILGYANQRPAIATITEAFDQHQQSTIRSQVLTNSIPAAYRVVAFAVAVVAILMARLFNVGLSEVSVLLFSLFQAMNMIGRFVADKTAVVQIIPAYEQLLSLRTQAKEMRQVSGSLAFQGLKSGVRFEGVCFSFPGHPEVLKGVDVLIPRGKMVALAGASGSGKTTFVDLLMGLHEPSGGQIFLDGVALAEYDMDTFRARIGYVPQESVLFNMSIKDNLTWSKPAATDEEIAMACRMAYAQEFIERLPQGLDTVVGDRGVRLSGGQNQRIALARAFLRKPDMLILDEATSSLDTYSEDCIRKAVKEFSAYTTVVVVAHRISTIRDADIIYVLDQGRVVESGSYQALVASGGHFAAATQAQGT